MKASNRRRIGHALVAGFAFLAIAIGNAAAVRADIIATFNSTTTNDYIYTGGSTQSSLTTSSSPLSGFVTYGTTFFSPNVPVAATITLNNVVSNTAAISSTQQDGWSGSYTITEGVHVLTVSFTNAALNVNGGAANLQGDATISANFGNPITTPESFSLALSGVNPKPVGLGVFGLTDFMAGDVNTNSATVVPEPSTMAIVGLGALGMIGYGLRRRKALGA